MKTRLTVILAVFLLLIFISISRGLVPINNDNLHGTKEVIKIVNDLDTSCPDEWHHVDGKCYRLYAFEHSWPQALAFCSRFGAILARIETYQENFFISKLVAKPQRAVGASTKTDYWIGLLSQSNLLDSNAAENMPFIWSNGAFVSRYIGFWAKEQPDHHSGSCTKISLQRNNNVEWRLEMCNLLLPFICEIPSCIRGQFFCHNGGCVPERAHCNGIDDCGDLSDELNCPASRPELACLKHEKGESGRFESPNFPAIYPAGANCRWVIEGPINTRIQLTFDSFETEENQDFVTVLEGGPAENTTLALAQLSGTPNEKQLTFTSSFNQMIVSFRSDSLIHARGFQATWKAVQISCGNTLIAQSYPQAFTSVEFPHSYPNGMECVWSINTEEGNLITLNVESFDVKENRDFIIIYDGPQPSAPVLARLTGANVPSSPIISTKNQIYIYFFADRFARSRDHSGFKITYKKGCDNTMRDSFGTIVSPGFLNVPYPPSKSCRYTIEVPEINNEQSSITLAINNFNLSEDDFLRIYEGGIGGRSLHENNGYNGAHSPPKIIYAKQGKVELEFVANSMRTSLGFNITYSINCVPLVVPDSVSISTRNTAYGTKVTVSCARGYEFVTGRGRFIDVYCELGGHWTESTLPSCQPVFCAPVPQISNGFAISATNVSFGGMAKYGCNDGFSFPSSKKIEEIFCTDEGRWTSTPKCRAETCNALVAFLNGERKLRFGDGTGYGSVYQFECHSGYRREGAATILCRADGRWSSPQPICKKLSCKDLPDIKNGRILIAQNEVLFFGDSAMVECNVGFRRVGADLINCLANQTLSTAPSCEDINECEERTANCAPRTTNCVNIEGGYFCQCQPGYKSQMACTTSSAISPISVKPSSGIYLPSSNLNSLYVPSLVTPGTYGRNWCADMDDMHMSLTFTFSNLKIVEKLRMEKVTNKGFPTRIRILYANETTLPLTVYRRVQLVNTDTDFSVSPAFDVDHLENANETSSDIFVDVLETSNNNASRIPIRDANALTAKDVNEKPDDVFILESIASTGSEVLILPRPLEAQVIRVEFIAFEENPCAKIDIIGCQKTNCIDINECEENNGYCEHDCHNTPGSHHCSCREGYDLFVADGQGELKLKDGETGKNDLDVLRFNKSCVPRHCESLNAPANGKIISTLNLKRLFFFPQVVEFACEFGYQIRGPTHLMCLADGTWNASAPSCIPASCAGAKNNSGIGLFIQPESATVAYGQNISVICSQQNRPGLSTPLSSIRQCIYDPREDGVEYWLSGPDIDCPLVDCGSPPALAGSYYEDNDEDNNKVGGARLFHCRPPYVLVGKSSYDDRMVRCNVDGTWDLGDLRCEGPVCPDPGHPAGGETLLTSVEESAIARFSCKRSGYRPFPNDAINCTLGTPCVLSEDVGISTGYIPDGAFSDNSDTTIWGYEPHKSRMSSTGWCGSKDAFIFLSVDLQRIYTLTTLRLAGVAGSGHLKGHVTKMQLFYKVQFSQNYDNYAKEFTTPSGNHNKMYEFNLNPPVRARYILLGITEYETNPCLRFDMQGCLAPLSPSHEIPSHLQVGWNASIPLCLDAEPPTFVNCPVNPIYASIDEHGQLLPVSFNIPEARDNFGIVAHIQVQPENFEPPFFIYQNLDVIYTAFDEAGNTADCIVRLRIPDTQPPMMKCPESYALWAEEGEMQRIVYFNETSMAKQLIVQDMSNVTDIRFEPPTAIINLGGHVTVEAFASDSFLNRNRCRFQVAFMPEPCSSGSLPIDDESTIKKCTKQGTSTVCTIECRAGYRMHDTSSLITNPLRPQQQQSPQQLQHFSCSIDGHWSPPHAPLACVPASQEPARYEIKMAIDYASITPIPSECLEGYQYLISGFFDTIDTVLTQRCSSSIQVFVRFLDVKFFSVSTLAKDGHYHTSANYTVQILPTILQKVFYQLCGLTLQTIFDLRVPGASTPIRNLLSVIGDNVVHTNTGVTSGCPSLNATSTSTSQNFECSIGEILRYSLSNDSTNFSENHLLPECLPCPKGTIFINNSCVACPYGFYQDKAGKTSCKLCPEATHTLIVGAQSVNACLPICGDGMYSKSGTIPCQLCPRHTFAGSPIPGGFKECEACPEGMYTARLGSTSVVECKLPCQAGHFSVTGLEPCSPCPINSYQPLIGQQRCLQCSNDTTSHETGRTNFSQCQPLDCSTIKCQNKGTCIIRNHKEVCQCRPGFTGRFCEEIIPICDSRPCLNGGVCEQVGGTFRCICLQNFTGTRCQFGPDECVGVNCPNGGICQDLPGINTKKCICRTGFTGSDCSEILDPCNSQNPCKNGADCIPLQLGRIKCKCLPGWEGQFCERNIDDCAVQPCALNSTCHDLLNDYECECPRGFTGKRCNLKENLCDPDPCLNGGKCFDTFFERKCICREGWAGTFCEQNIDECSKSPCQNGAICRDQENGYLCECAPGFHGSQCQHLVDHCSISPCRNNATCVNKGPNYACECRLGFEGVHCEHNIDDCASGKCDVQGTEMCEDLINGFKCHCRIGFNGELCKNRINECDLEQCQNNGTCINTSSGFECECKAGWRGERCQELETHFCDPNPCQNDGKCVNLVADFFCVCPEGVNGKRCEITPNRCLGEPCHNGGVCGDFGSRLECTCPKGFVGAGCQYLQDACHSNICKNGGTCVVDTSENSQLITITNKAISSFKCLCPPGFTGTECELEINECQPNPCPMTATCIDQINSYYCHCSLNATGANCEKRVDPDYDLHFYSGRYVQSAHASLRAPFKLLTEAFSLSAWVRFERKSTKATFLTIYNSDTSNYASNLREVLRITADSVRLALFSDIKPLLLRLPANYRLDDGRWNNIIITWRSSNGGEYSIFWNSVRIFAEKGYGLKRTLEINAFVNLGDPLTEQTDLRQSNVIQFDNEEHFIGSITQVNLWTRLLDFEQEIPIIVQRCQGSPVIFSGLILRFAGYEQLSGKVERITKSTCGRINSETNDNFVPTTQSDISYSNTNSRIHVLSCPKDVFVITPLKEVNITWQEPHFASLSSFPLDRIEQNLKPGQIFTWGTYTALYIAYANNSSSAICTFKIYVRREFCPDLADPENGIQSCENWGSELKYRACSIRCNEGYAFSRTPAVFYSCAEDGVWRPQDLPNQSQFRYPSCTKMSPAERVARIKFSYPMLKLCNFVGKNTITEKILQKIQKLNTKWNICAISNNSMCEGVRINIDCADSMQSSIDNDVVKFLKRHRRATTSTRLFNVRVEIPIRNNTLFDKQNTNASNVIGENTTRMIDGVELLEHEALAHDLFNLEQVLPNAKPDLTTFQIQSGFNCLSGYSTKNNFCVPCAPGSFFDVETRLCELCPLGTYQSKSAQLACEICPDNKPVTAGLGLTSANDCKEKCMPGHYFNLISGVCEECGHGFYQPNDGAFKCQPCGIGKTTLESTAHSEEECRDECADGEQLTKVGTCQPCPIGTYRTKGINKRCVLCPQGTTTEMSSATHREQCNTPKCVPGQFLVAISKHCQLCPRGSYQDEPLQATCKLCPTDYTTTTEGATHESQCYSTNQCKMGEDNCSWKATCIDLPDENDVPSFRCECNPGYRGNGTYCIDACLNHCLNDGICRKNRLTSREECICKENFSGERCEIRFQPRSQRLAILVASAGGCVLLLIVIVIVIVMISMRFNRVQRHQYDKPIMGGGATIASNFLYGRPTLNSDGPNSTIGFGNRTPVGFYYEDDDQIFLNNSARDSKNTYIGADTTTRAIRGEPKRIIGDDLNVSDSNENPDIFENQNNSGDENNSGMFVSATPIIAVGQDLVIGSRQQSRHP